MPYEIYKLLHILFVLSFVLCLGSYFFANEVTKPVKIMTGVFSLLIFVAGMGLIARIGINHGEPWPWWIKTKVIIWLTIAVLTPILGKRIQGDLRKKIPLALLIPMALAIYMAIYKPF